MHSHDNEYLSKLREHERFLDNLMDQHNGTEEEPEYDPCEKEDKE